MESAALITRIREILPSYDALPDLLDNQTVAKVLGIGKNTLPADRCGARRFDIGFVRMGRLVKYPKLEVGKWLVRNAVNVKEQ